MKIDKTQQISNCKLWGERDETVNHKVTEYSKLAQKEYKTRYDGVGKVIHRELCKRLNFDHTMKWYLHKPESILENEMYNILRASEIQIGPLILARQSDLVLIKKKKRTCHLVDFAILGEPQSEIKGSQKINKYLDLARKLKNHGIWG